MTSKRKTSEVWSYFTEETGTPFATCNLCQSKVERGKEGERSSWSATPIWTHLSRYHEKEHKEARAQRQNEDDTDRAKKRKSEAEDNR